MDDPAAVEVLAGALQRPVREVRLFCAQAFLGSLAGVQNLGFVFAEGHVGGGKVNSIWTR